MSAVHDDRPAKDVDDLDNALDKLDEKCDTLREKLLGLGIDYVNKIDGRLGGESQTIYQIIDEIFHREGSFRSHIKLLLRIQHDAEVTLRSNAENLEVKNPARKGCLLPINSALLGSAVIAQQHQYGNGGLFPSGSVWFLQD